MRKSGKSIFRLGLGLVLYSCSPADNKPDAVVISNDQLRDDATAIADTSTFADHASAAPGRRPDSTGTDRFSYPAADTGAGDQATLATGEITGKASGTSPGKKVVRTRASVQSMLRRDGRLARTMSLQRFGAHMTRKWAFYRGFGELSYDDGKVEIKITDEELKIETPEGKFKRESDEMKLKTDTRKVKKEIRS
jgi:hypothetical protein